MRSKFSKKVDFMEVMPVSVKKELFDLEIHEYSTMDFTKA